MRAIRMLAMFVFIVCASILLPTEVESRTWTAPDGTNSSSSSGQSSGLDIPNLPDLPTVYERQISMKGFSQLEVPLKSDSYRRSELFEVVRCPPWLNVEPYTGIIGVRGMSILLSVDKNFLSLGPNMGQVIIQTSAGYTILNVSKDYSPGSGFWSFMLVLLLTYLGVGLVVMAVEGY